MVTIQLIRKQCGTPWCTAEATHRLINDSGVKYYSDFCKPCAERMARTINTSAVPEAKGAAAS